jgi:hypothetical protein
MEEKSALVAQPAERRFRNPSLLFWKGRGGYLRSWVQIPSRAFILIIITVIIVVETSLCRILGHWTDAVLATPLVLAAAAAVAVVMIISCSGPKDVS